MTSPTMWKNSPHQDVIAGLRAEISRRLTGTDMSAAERDAQVSRLVSQVLDQHARDSLAGGRMPLDPPDEKFVAVELRESFSALGPFESLLRDRRVTNIFVNGPVVWVAHSDGSKHQLPPLFTSRQEMIERIRDIAARSGVDERRFDRGMPRVSVRLPDGSRMFATLLAREPSVSIRRYALLHTSLDELAAKHQLMDPVVRDLLTATVRARKNMIICGGPYTGKTTFLRAAAKAIGPGERIITIEDTDELALDQDPDHPDCVALQAREANMEGEGGVDLAELVRYALRMSPDRVFLGEARGGEVVPLLNCMSQGTDGSMATIHTSSSKQAFTKLMVYAAQSEERLPFDATAPLVGVAVDFVVHLAWSANNHHRVVSSIREVLHAEGAEVISNEIWRPGPDGAAVPAAPIRAETVDELAAAGFNPDLLRGW
ncbi:type II secretion system protein E [Actinoplanes sp. ATCC 53533]|uniref:CpaF family protein n=1 Tax=Actinoplanes sp. ATCC 53533 TaxID=1288362 RepID=UPI000F7AE45D|nr:ATPase, T2SS/T4P/T4SS family [Actinoplanes sp. ATCC 53533]RSM65125.1 type II secretion system protein E [Actinoplanes sp. ATCC 53533]